MKILRLKEVLKEKGMTGKDLSIKVNTTEASISNLVKGKSIPRKDLLIKIAEVLDVDIRDLFNSTKEDESVQDLIRDIRSKLDQIESKI